MIDRATAEHYVWGDGCDGWRLVNRPDLTVIHERMLPGTAEVRHYHRVARQFFFVLSGSLMVEMEGRREVLQAQQGLEIAPGEVHQVRNSSGADVEFLVISHPSTARDRIVHEP
jgi:mannose-6-phosphate isomerase-like protein (cupin superfamily)